VRVVIAGGGTGGHLFPALAVHEALRRRWPGSRPLFVGASAGVEAAIVPRLGHAFRGLDSRQVKGRGRAAQVAALLAIPSAVRQALRILREFSAQVILGVGGYASFPTVLAGWVGRIPCVVHEQNAYPGLANRCLGRMASAVAVSFEETATFFPGRHVVVTGNPVRPEIRSGDVQEARTYFRLAPGAFTVLVFGGSQGAHRINAAMMEALPKLSGMGERIQFLHATGEADLPGVRQAYERWRQRARVEAFFHEMGTAYRAADFAICRAGASTIFELAAVGKPALLVPYPHAANDHQRLNAEAMVRAGAAWLVPDQHCDGQRIAAAIQAALEKPEILRRMEGQARTLARPDAADGIVDLLMQVAGSG
jgi:UDP-N-acetylglucosamine--N-acetylmuramyl-(pentapeptide) pyrophosphoryl-undecaprenol N-acetylglucosamine transferase